MPYRKFSAILSLVVSIGFFAAMVALIFVGPRLFELYINYRASAIDVQKFGELMKVYKRALYPCIAVGLPAAYCVVRLLINIIKDRPFAKENVTYIRIIAWGCIAVGIITLVAAFYFLPFVFVAIAAGFGGIMVHAMKNVMQSAVEIKEENDLTI